MTRSSYSLSGHLLLTVTPFTSILNGDPIRPPSMRLTALNITFEGKCESISPKFGYSATRLCRVSKNLIGGEGDCEPITLNCTGENVSQQPWKWSVLFDLAIPGWLPPTLEIPELIETGYGLHARAVLETLSAGPSSKSDAGLNTPNGREASTTKKSSPWNLGSLPSFLCSSFKFMPRPKVVEADLVPVHVVRLRSHPQSDPDTTSALLHETSSLFPAFIDLAIPTFIAPSQNLKKSIGAI